MKEHRLVAAFCLLIFSLCVAGVSQAQQAWDTNVLQWVAPATCTSGQPIANCAVTSYRVERSATATGTFASVGTSTTTTFTHTSAVAGQNCYRVIAQSAKGDSGPTNVACKVNTAPSGPPSPPTNLTVVEPIAFNVRADYGRFAFVRGTRAGMAKLGAACDESRITADGYTVISRPRSAVVPRPPEGAVLVAKCRARGAA